MKKLKKVIIVRHGDYERTTKELTSAGITQTRNLVERINRKINDLGKIQLFTSNIRRSIHTGKVIASSLEVSDKKQLFELEWDKYYSREKLYPIVAKRIEDDTETVIIVTHFEMPSGLADMFMKEGFGTSVEPSISANAGGFLCCMQSGEFRKI
jgi:phosphohistidine phosphatase SixA